GCHGGAASGFIGPDLADGRWRYGGSDAEVFSSIYYGRPKGTPAFGGVLGPRGRGRSSPTSARCRRLRTYRPSHGSTRTQAPGRTKSGSLRPEDVLCSSQYGLTVAC